MQAKSQRQWAKRTVLAVSDAFPRVEHKNWPLCEQLLPHAFVCSALIEHYQLSTVETAYLLNQTDFYLHERARYLEADRLYERALAIREEQVERSIPTQLRA